MRIPQGGFLERIVEFKIGGNYGSKKINDFSLMCEAQCEMAKDLVVWIEKMQATYTEHPECIADMVKGYLKNFIKTWGKKEVENENN